MMGPTYMYHGKLCSHTYTMYTACLYILHLHTDCLYGYFKCLQLTHILNVKTKCYVIKSCDILLENLTKSPVRSWCVRSSWERCLGSIWCVRSSWERCMECIWCVHADLWSVVGAYAPVGSAVWGASGAYAPVGSAVWSASGAFMLICGA